MVKGDTMKLNVALAIAFLFGLGGVAYGTYVAFIYQGGTTELYPFVIAAVAGAITVCAGWIKSAPWAMVVGFSIMALAPTGFLWIFNLGAAIGAGLSVVSYRRESPVSCGNS